MLVRYYYTLCPFNILGAVNKVHDRLISKVKLSQLQSGLTFQEGGQGKKGGFYSDPTPWVHQSKQVTK